MPSIVNGLFSGRSGISSHGTAIAVVGDNISNSSTVGYKNTRAEFQDMVACGQATGKITGGGSTISSISNLFEQGTLESTGRTLDLAIDGNGYFVCENNDGARYYTRAGNFKVDAQGVIVNQDNYKVLGYPDGGTGSLEEININTLSQNNIATGLITVSGNLCSNSPIISSGSIPTVPLVGDESGYGSTAVSYAALNEAAEFSTVVDVFDSLGDSHTVTFYFFHTGTNKYEVRGYVNSEDVDMSGEAIGYPRQIADDLIPEAKKSFEMTFNSSGSRNNKTEPGSYDLRSKIKWANGSKTSNIDISMNNFTQYSSASNIISLTQDGQGVGAVESLSIEKDGQVFAVLSNGQTSTIGYIGLANFANSEGLVRVGGQLWQQSPSSGEPIAGRAGAGTFGDINSGSLELSTVDIANEFIRLITLQRGYQANSRIITTIDGLLDEVIRMA